ncbi:hypothetical protein, partial [Escherichia coli]
GNVNLRYNDCLNIVGQGQTDTGTTMPQAMPYRTALYPHIPSLISSSGYRKHQAKNGESAALMAEKYSISGCPILKEAIPVAKKRTSQKQHCSVIIPVNTHYQRRLSPVLFS